MGKSLVEMTADIIQAQCGSTNMTTEEVTVAIQSIFKALQALQTEECQLMQEGFSETDSTENPISPEKSILKNKVICLECGQEFKMISPKHLKSHGLTGKEYRKKYGFSMRQPLCAKSLSDRRKKAGKQRGLPDNLRKAIARRTKKKSSKQTTFSPGI